MDNINLNQSGIYAITSSSGKRYVGSAVNIRKRWNEHRRDLARGKHHCPALQHAHHKYGCGLVYSVLILCPKEELIKEEQWYMDSSAPGTLYNSAPTAGSQLGTKHSDATKARIAAAKRGTTHSEEARAKMSAAQLGKVQKNNTSGYVGVYWDTRNRVWRSSRYMRGKLLSLGSYPTAELANQARQNFDRILDYYDHS